MVCPVKTGDWHARLRPLCKIRQAQRRMRKAANSLKVTAANDCFDIYVSVTRKVPMLFRKPKREKLICVPFQDH